MEFQFSWKTYDDLMLHGNCWLPEGESPKAMICIIHGFGEHIGRYEHVASYFTSQNLGVIGFDLRGHGKSEGKRGVVPDYEAVLTNITEFLALVNDKFKNLPLVLYGHSMGGNLASVYMLKKKPSIVTACIITSPWFKLPTPPSKVAVFMGKLMGSIIPSFTVKTKLEPELLSSDITVGRKYEDDPLTHGSISSALFTGVTEAGDWALDNANTLEHPMLMMHGMEDEVTSQRASQEFARKAPKELITYKTWDGLRHELHNELAKEKVLGYELEFIQRHLN